MDINYIKKEKNEVELLVKDEDMGIFNLIIDIASSKRDVDFVSKKQDNRLKKEYNIFLKTKEKPAKDILIECINEAEEKINVFLNNLERAVKKNDK